MAIHKTIGFFHEKWRVFEGFEFSRNWQFFLILIFLKNSPKTWNCQFSNCDISQELEPMGITKIKYPPGQHWWQHGCKPFFVLFCLFVCLFFFFFRGLPYNPSLIYFLLIPQLSFPTIWMEIQKYNNPYLLLHWKKLSRWQYIL